MPAGFDIRLPVAFPASHDYAAHAHGLRPLSLAGDPVCLKATGTALKHGSPRVLILTTTPWPVCARLAMSLSAQGCRVFALCAPGHAIRSVTSLRGVFSYSALSPLRSLQSAIAACQPQLIVPCDDRAVWQMHALHARSPSLQPLIEFSIGSSAHYPTVRSRFRFHETARALGLATPETRPVHSESDLHQWFERSAGPAVLKRDGSFGGNGVRIVGDIQEAIAAWRSLSRTPSLAYACKRWLINRDPLAFSGRSTAEAPEVCIQRFVEGTHANVMAACQKGRVLGTIAAEALATQGPTGASTIIRIISHDGIRHATASIAQALQLSGFFGLDFLMEGPSGRPVLIELNPRCTQLGHLALSERGDLAGLLSETLGAIPSRLPARIRQDLIAFFPQAFAYSAQSPYLAMCHQDIPWSEPALIRELLREPWEHRQWYSRCYHWIRGSQKNPCPHVETMNKIVPKLTAYLVGGDPPVTGATAAELLTDSDLGER